MQGDEHGWDTATSIKRVVWFAGLDPDGGHTRSTLQAALAGLGMSQQQLRRVECKLVPELQQQTATCILEVAQLAVSHTLDCTEHKHP